MEKVVLKATKRTVTGKQVRALRRAGKLPAVLYGHRIDSTPISLDTHETSLLLSRLTSSSLVTIRLDGKEYPTLVREKQCHPIKRHLMHLDFQALSLTEKTHAKVAIELHGIAPAVKDFDAIIVHSATELEVECLPQDLPERITVDISTLAEPGDSIHVRDIKLPGQVEILTNPDDVIVSATAAKVEVIEEIPEEEAAEPEVAEGVATEEETSED